MGSHQGEGGEPPSPRCRHAFDAAQDTFVFVGSEHTLLSHGQIFTLQPVLRGSKQGFEGFFGELQHKWVCLLISTIFFADSFLLLFLV